MTGPRILEWPITRCHTLEMVCHLPRILIIYHEVVTLSYMKLTRELYGALFILLGMLYTRRFRKSQLPKRHEYYICLRQWTIYDMKAEKYDIITYL